MVKDIKYIIKRILISVGVVLVLSFLRGNLLISAKAMNVSNYGIGASEYAIDNMTTNIVKSVTGNPFSVFSGYSGFIIGTFAIQKVDGSATSINVFPKQVYVNTNNNPSSYVCEVGSAMTGNSTFNGGTFTYKCPIVMGSQGLQSIVFDFQDIQTNFTSIYRLSIGSLVSFQIEENANFNVDTSGTTNAINNQISNDNSNTQNIINNQESNTQDIIDNQNTNTEKEIESHSVCSFFDKSNIVTSKRYLDSSGIPQALSNSSLGVTDYISINSRDKLELLSNASGFTGYFCFYNVNKENISCISQRDSSIGFINIPLSASYFRATIDSSSNKPTFKLCRNGNQAIVDSQNQLNDTLNNSSVSDPNSDIANMSSKTASNNSITQLLTLPITLFQNVLNNINGSCSSYNLGSLYGTSLTLPCINLESILGSTLWGVIDILISGLFILSFRKKMVDIFNHMSSLNDRGNELE